jgi:hypothetical protein
VEGREFLKALAKRVLARSEQTSLRGAHSGVKRSDSKLLVSLAILMTLILGIALRVSANYWPNGGTTNPVTPFSLAMDSSNAMTNYGGL